MKTLWLALLTSLALCLSSPLSATIIFEASLNASQEVPSNASTATGSATLTLNDAQDRLSINIQLFGLDLDGLQTLGTSDDDVTRMHLHSAPAGLNGAIVFGLIDPDNDLNNDLLINAAAGTIFSAWDLTEGLGTTLADELPNLLNNGLYINVHTSVFPGGEIRGQVNRVSEPAMLLLMSLGLAALVRRRASQHS